jgi:hypothetical protein
MGGIMLKIKAERIKDLEKFGFKIQTGFHFLPIEKTTFIRYVYRDYKLLGCVQIYGDGYIFDNYENDDWLQDLFKANMIEEVSK